jgi:hypothetical protein
MEGFILIDGHVPRNVVSSPGDMGHPVPFLAKVH